MVFSSTIFLIYFLPIVLVINVILPKYLKNYWLLVASLIFYSWGEPSFFFVLITCSVINFFAVQKMNLLADLKRKVLFSSLIIFNLAFLVYFKYSNFFIESINEGLAFLGNDLIKWNRVILPIGISFFTFQSLTYIIDVYRKDTQPQVYVHNYILYSFLFPHLIAGPIVKYNFVSDQINNRDETAFKFIAGFVRFSIGLGKKVLIANVIGEYSRQLLYESNSVELTSGTVWLGMLAYTFQIYFDFSGYSDMAIGLGKMLGFHFPENFDRPYISSSISEFWRKWHITLGDFMKNYLYIPLGGNKVSNWKIYRNLLIVFFLSGLWHGDNWTFIAWGLFHGFWLIIDRLFLLKILNKIKFLAIPFTFLVVLNGWVLFQAPSIESAMEQYKIMWQFNHFSLQSIQNQSYFNFHILIAVTICLLGLVPIIRRFSNTFISEQKKPIYLISTVLIAGIIFILSMAEVIAGNFNPFIYFKF
jgi:alginate O-acetyltransferase complex protein AlgI